MNFMSITLLVFSLPYANFEAAVKPRKIHKNANYSSPSINERSVDNVFPYILYFAPFINTHKL